MIHLILVPIILFLTNLSSSFISTAFCQQDPDAENMAPQLFKRVFGDHANLDPDFHGVVSSSTPGLRHYRDTDGDSRPDEVWFIDLALRHPEKSRPLLVKVIDEDNDLIMGCEPDLDSDLYVADWKGDGTVDCVLDYTDIDADNDVDEMGIYFPGPWKGYFSEPALRVWWGRDTGDDNLLWYDVGYNYIQSLCEFRSHFGGDEIFVCFALPLSAPEWVPFWENPFVFMDHDRDGATEEVVRFCGIDRDIENIRHSIDADNDSTNNNPRDYDVSISGWAPGSRLVDRSMGPGRSNLKLEDTYTEIITLRGIKSGPFVSHQRTLDLIKQLSWVRRQLAWDELDHNIDQQNHASEYERWEGIISAGNEYFPQIGGPHCGYMNIRYEVDVDPATGSFVYFHPVDNRIHLTGADHSWLEVDANLDGIRDFLFEMKDTNSDGFIDTWSIDINKDGNADDSWSADPTMIIENQEYTFNNVHAFSEKARIEYEKNYKLERMLKKVYQLINENNEGILLGVENIFPHLEQSHNISFTLREKLLSSEQSLAFVLGVSIDVLICYMKNIFDKKEFWSKFDNARSIGDIERMCLLIHDEFHIPEEQFNYQEWKNGLLLFTTKKVAWNDTWLAPNVGWESELTAYRCYWGQFDFFGKTKEFLLYPNLSEENYHKEQEWGIDALLVGDTGGCGGITLYLDGNPYPVRNPKGKGRIKFKHQLLEEKDDRVSIENIAEGIGPEEEPESLRFICTSVAGHPETRIEVSLLPTSRVNKTSVGIELVRLNSESLFIDTAAGVMASWGIQSNDIGTIGMSILFPPERYKNVVSSSISNQVIISISPEQPLVYHIYCDWLNGRRFNRCPSSSDWFKNAVQLAEEIRNNQQ